MPAKLEQLKELVVTLIEQHLDDVYTTIPVIIQEIDPATRRCTVVHKDDREALAQNVPIATPYAGNGYGEIYPIRAGDEALARASMLPLRHILEKRGFIDNLPPKHSINDLIVFPKVWFDEDTVPTTQEGEYALIHESNVEMRIKMDGSAHLANATGTGMYFGADNSSRIEAVAADGTTAGIYLYPDGTFEIQSAAGEGFSTPLPPADQTVTGTAQKVYGIEAGDPAAKRIDRLNNGSETLEDADPIVDVSDDTETTYVNPDGLRMAGPVDLGLYEFRRAIPERREADPDPTITDETNPAYIELPATLRQQGKIPIGYMYILSAGGTHELKMWGSAGAPVTIQAL